MIVMSIDISELTAIYEKLIQGLEGAASKEALRDTVDGSVELIKRRIQQYGMGSEGRLTSKAQSRLGAYSKSHGLARRKKGYNIGMIDWTMSGSLMDDFQVGEVDAKSAKIGFPDNRKVQVQSLEGTYGGDNDTNHGRAFEFTEKEFEEATRFYVDELLENIFR